MNKVLCCTVIYDAIRHYEKEIIKQFTNMRTDFCEFLIIYDCEDKDIECNKNIIQIKNNLHYDPIGLREYCIEYAYKNDFTYFMFCDADDIQLPKKLKVLYKMIEKEDVDFVSHNMTIVNRDKSVLKEKMFPVEKNINIDLDFISDKNAVGFGNSIFKTRTLKKILPLNKNVICDWWIGLNILINDGRGILLKDILSYYVQYDDNIANLISFDSNSLYNEYQIKQKMYEEIKKKYPSYSEYVSLLEKKLIREYNKKKHKTICNNDYWWNLLNS